jgi:hypothetical protein
MKASYTLDGVTDASYAPGATATVAPPFAMAGKGWPAQEAMDAKFNNHMQNIKKTDPRAAQLAQRVRSARGSSEEIRVVTQALIKDNALKDIRQSGSLEQDIQEMMFENRIGTDCAGYVQQAYLFARGAARSTAGLKPDIELENLGNLEHQGFARIDPSAAAPGDLVIMDPPSKNQPGHTIIVYSRREATADDKKELKDKLEAAGQRTDNSSFLADAATVYVFEFDSSWGSGGDPKSGGIQRRTFWYNPRTLEWAWTTDDIMTAKKAFVGDMPYWHHLRGFYRGPSTAAAASVSAGSAGP